MKPAKLTIHQAISIMHSGKKPEHKRWMAIIYRMINGLLRGVRP